MDPEQLSRSPPEIHPPMRARLLTAPLLILATACGNPFGPSDRRVVGFVDGLGRGASSVAVPASVAVGAAFEVVIPTTWPNGCASRGDVEIRAVADGVTLTPYDRVRRGSQNCTDAVQTFVHTVALRADAPGPFAVTVRGAERDGIVSERFLVDVR
jgi:hypothetical protein